MIAFSHDPDAGTLYCYFTELSAGQVSYELEYPAALLLDHEGAVIGIRIDLDDEVTLDQLEVALEQPHAALDMQTGSLRVAISDETLASEVALPEAAILDLDDDGRILGVDLAVPEGYRTEQALARLAPFMVEVGQDDEDAEGEPEEGEAEAGEPQAAAGLVAQPSDEQFRSGFVALVGKPNVGKSTLLNRLLGQKISIVSPRPQTTRVPVRGILHRPNAQIVFIDTPGIHTPRHKLGAFMVDVARRAIPDADLVCMMIDISTPPSRLDERIAAEVRRARSPKLLLLNKVDVKVQGEGHLQAYRDLGPWEMEVAISARKGLGLESLLDEIVRRLPVGPAFYPADQVSDQSERQLAAELVREQVLYNTDQEVPHSVAVEVDEWEEKENALYIRMTINVEKESQKGIIIGSGGAMLKRIGSAARAGIERLVGRQVFLELWVKARPNWRDDPASLGWLGYRSKDWR
jgi:GTPase